MRILKHSISRCAAGAFSIMWFLMMGTFETQAVTRSLIIAVGKYPVKTGWRYTSANNDVQIIQNTLRKKGVKEENLYILRDERATYRSIVAEFKMMESRINSSDTLYLFFSGHGQQILDDNGDEEDGWDEAFVPYDAHKRFKKGIYEGENHLRDDEIGVWLERFRKKLGAMGAVWVVIDACHSGTANRDESDKNIRGTTYPFHAPDTNAPLASTNSQSFRLLNQSGYASIGVYSACLPDEINYEYRGEGYKYFGRLTYAICALLNSNSSFNSFSALFGAVEQTMKKMSSKDKIKQNPYFESSEIIRP